MGGYILLEGYSYRMTCLGKLCLTIGNVLLEASLKRENVLEENMSYRRIFSG